MIKNIFLPSMIKNYVFFSQRIISCELGQTELKGARVKASGSQRTVEGYISVTIDQRADIPLEDRQREAAVRFRDEIGQYDQLSVIIPGYLCVFKEITVPFTDHERIRKILPFEIEQQLPFALQDAVIDSVVLETGQQNSTVLVVACKREILDQYLAPLISAGLIPTTIKVDIIEWISFLKAIPNYAQLETAYALLDINAEITRIIIINDGKIIATRSLARGLGARFADQEYRVRAHLNDPQIRESLQALVEEIRFTLQASLLKSGIVLSKIYLAGLVTEISDAIDFIQKACTTPTEKFYAYKIIHNGTTFTQQQKGIPAGYELCVACALQMPLSKDFTLGVRVTAQDIHLVQWRLITALILSVCILSSLALHTFFSVRKINNEAYDAQQEAVSRLKKIFNLRKSVNLETVIKEARVELVKEEQIWFALSTGNRFSFLTNLQELSSRIDRDGLGLDLKRLALKRGDNGADDTLVIEGSVRDYDALRNFEESLEQSKLFKNVPKLQETKFSLTLALAKNIEP